MANEPQTCNCAFCLTLCIFDVKNENIYDSDKIAKDSDICKTSKKQSVYTCNPKDKSVISKSAVRISVSQVKHKKTACEVALPAK